MKTTIAADAIQVDVWGSRGSRNLIPSRSRIGNQTACYSVLRGQDLLILDAGQGLAALGHAMRIQPRFRPVKTVHVFVSHAHMDHWEGLKDVEWFWRRDNGLDVTIHATREALKAIDAGHRHPLYVSLEQLAAGKLARIRRHAVKAGDLVALGSWTVEAFRLNHYSGGGDHKLFLDTVGFRIAADSGATVSYISDHEPTPETRDVERRMIQGTHLAVVDAHFANVRDQMFGHGSQEHAARLARDHPEALILAGHHGPIFTDPEIRAAHRLHGRGLANFRLAVEGTTYQWNAKKRAFRPA